jgi:hypothetical protein
MEIIVRALLAESDESSLWQAPCCIKPRILCHCEPQPLFSKVPQSVPFVQMQLRLLLPQGVSPL